MIFHSEVYFNNKFKTVISSSVILFRNSIQKNFGGLISTRNMVNVSPGKTGMICPDRPPSRVCLPQFDMWPRSIHTMHGRHHALTQSHIWPRCKTFRVNGATVWMRSSIMWKNWRISTTGTGEKLATTYAVLHWLMLSEHHSSQGAGTS